MLLIIVVFILVNDNIPIVTLNIILIAVVAFIINMRTVTVTVLICGVIVVIMTVHVVKIIILNILFYFLHNIKLFSSASVFLLYLLS